MTGVGKNSVSVLRIIAMAAAVTTDVASLQLKGSKVTCTYKQCSKQLPVAEIYTSEKSGSDETGDGTQDKPFKTVLQV